MIGTLTLVDQNPQARMQNLRHELARYFAQTRKVKANPNIKIDLLELNDNLRSLVALCPDQNIKIADLLMHEKRNKMTKIYGYARLKNNSNN